jgi:uncharacterized protein with GYD domain
MTIYISRGCYSATAIQGMMAKPEDREAAVSKLFEKAGGKLLAYYVTLGDYDWLLIGDFPNEKKLASAILAAAAGGSVTNVQTTVAMTSKQAMGAFKEAKDVAASFKNAGR